MSHQEYVFKMRTFPWSRKISSTGDFQPNSSSFNMISSLRFVRCQSYLVKLSLLTILAFWIAGCSPKETGESSLPTTTVSVASIEAREVQDFVVFTGRTESVESVEIRARVSGYLTETKFKDGQDVKKGDVLFIIDPRPYQADVDRAKAEFDRAQADLKLSVIEYNRAAELRQKNTISASDFDTKAAAYLKAQGGQASAKAALDTAVLNLEFTTITSPITGHISKASVTPGNLVSPDMPDPLTVVVSTNPVYAYAQMDERQLLRYIRLMNEAKQADEKLDPAAQAKEEPKTTIAMQLADETGFPHEGVIDFADNRVSRDTGTITVRGVFEDPEDVLAPGLFVRLRFPGGAKYQALLVPQESISIDQGLKFIYVVTANNTVEYRQVEVGALQSDGWKVVKGNLKAGEKVIVDGGIKVRPGSKVKTIPWEKKTPLSQNNSSSKN